MKSFSDWILGAMMSIAGRSWRVPDQHHHVSSMTLAFGCPHISVTSSRLCIDHTRSLSSALARLISL
jgi:hypothetical protein